MTEFKFTTQTFKVRDLDPDLADAIEREQAAWEAYLASLTPEEAERARAQAREDERRLFFGDPS